MATHDDILLCKLEAYATLSQRVSNLERWQAWLKGGWAALAAIFALLSRG